MLTKVILEGVMGAKFGRSWNLAVSSPNEALRMIGANKSGLIVWIRNNAEVYDRYKVICTYEDGRKEFLDDDTYMLERKIAVIRFVPVPKGAGSTAKIVVGAILITVGYFVHGPWSPYLYKVGAMLILSGVIETLTPVPKRAQRDQSSPGASFDSDYFNGPVNTDQQGSPVPLIYGRVLVGSHAVSAMVTVDKLM